MKALSVSTHFNIGGISNYMLALASELKNIGVETVIATSGGDMEVEARQSSIPHFRINIDTKFEFHPKLFIAAMQLKSIIEKERIDIIHAHSRVAQAASVLASRMTGVPVVTTCHGYFKKRLRKVFDTWGARVIAISDAVRQHIISDLGVSPDRVRLIYSGVDCDRFMRKYSADEIAIIKNGLGLRKRFVVGTIGRLSPVKGHAHFLEALASISSKRSDVEGLIVGDGPEREALQKQAESLGIKGKVKFISSNVDTPDFLAIMDVFVFPSLKEGLGIALLEALASGRASVSSDTGGISDIVENGSTGVLVKVADHTAMAKAVSDLLDDPARREMLGSRGRDLVRERFTLSRMAREVAGLYEEVIDQKVVYDNEK
ncbi:MAG TPA: glycosyltransferase family 4 protein [Candidatus Omnitrophota bacterium]|nr:glycosyltransferase family 4 protein [Candidatus Omnitrophota bacterium]